MKLLIVVKVFRGNSYSPDADREIEIYARPAFLSTVTRLLADEIVSLVDECIYEATEEEDTDGE